MSESGDGAVKNGGGDGAVKNGPILDWQANKSLGDSILYMFTNKMQCDVQFIFPAAKPRLEAHGLNTNNDSCNEPDTLADTDAGAVLEAHKFLLISRSSVFYTMFCGSLCESGAIQIVDIDIDVFKQLLLYMYTDNASITADNCLHLLYAANKYLIPALAEMCNKYVETQLSPSTLAAILDQAVVYGDTELQKRCMDFLKTPYCYYNSSILDKYHFTYQALQILLEDGDEVFQEKDLFTYCNEWAISECEHQQMQVTNENKRRVLGCLLYLICVPDLSYSDLGSCVSPSKLLTMEEELAVYQYNAGYKNDIEFSTTSRQSPTLTVTTNNSEVTISSRFDWIFHGFQCNRDSIKTMYWNVTPSTYTYFIENREIPAPSKDKSGYRFHESWIHRIPHGEFRMSCSAFAWSETSIYFRIADSCEKVDTTELNDINTREEKILPIDGNDVVTGIIYCLIVPNNSTHNAPENVN